MTIAETPVEGIKGGNHRATGYGVHLVARNYRKGTRLDTHMHREAQLVYAARGTMQVTTPKGRWLVPPDRAVWVPARLEHAIDVLADVQMRTLYFDLAWLAREQRSESLAAEFVVRVSPLLHQAILALFDNRDDPGRTELLVKLAMLELDQAEGIRRKIPRPSFPCRMSRAAGAPPTSCSAIPLARMRSRPWRARSAPRRGRCRACLPRRRSLASRAGASAPALPPPLNGFRWIPKSRSSSWQPTSAMPACRRFPMPSGK